jgi:FtsH-binding integral membrane protein
MNLVRLLLIVVLAVAAAGCELIVDIFQAGMVVGVIFVLLFVGIILWMLRKLRRK